MFIDPVVSLYINMNAPYKKTVLEQLQYSYNPKDQELRDGKNKAAHGAMLDNKLT